METAETICAQGDSLSSLNNFDEAVECYTKALTLEPQHYVAVFKRGLAFLKLGRLEEALIDFTTASTLNPTDSNAQVNIGLVLMGKNDLKMPLVHSIRPSLFNQQTPMH